MNDCPRASVFRRTRRRTRLGLEQPEVLQFSEPDHVDLEEWERVCRRPIVATATPALFSRLASRVEVA